MEAPVVDVAGRGGDARPLDVRGTAPPQAPPSSAGGFAGDWLGVGRQNDGQEWDMGVHIWTIEPGVCARADYPTIPCAGEWLCERASDGVVDMHERLLDDSATRCVDHGTMTMKLGPDGTLEWAWVGQGQTATAKLERRR